MGEALGCGGEVSSERLQRLEVFAGAQHVLRTAIACLLNED